jgi:hypothetical protein
MKTLSISREIIEYQFILVLVDYNPHSKSLVKERLALLGFANQMKIFHSGFGMWKKRMEEINGPILY